MKKMVLSAAVLVIFILSGYGQAEKALNKGGCGSKTIRARYASKAQIAGSQADGRIVAVNNLMLTRQELTAFTFTMEPGAQYDLHLIFDPAIKNKLAPHPEAWGNVYVNGTGWKRLSKQAGTDISYELPVVNNKQEVEVKFMGSNYYDLRDASMPEDVCAIIYAVKRKQADPVPLTPVVKEKKTNEPGTIVPEKRPTVKNEIFSNWEQAKTKLNWQWLEVPATDKNVRRYFSESSLMVLQKTFHHAWTQAVFPRTPFPAYWNYEATFNFVKGESENPAIGLMLPGVKNGEEIKIMFLVYPMSQTWFFGYYNVPGDKWVSVVTGITKPVFSTAVNKYDPAYNFVANRLRMSREGKEVQLYVNNTLVQNIKVGPGNVALNKINGIGISGRGKQGYYVTGINFWVME